VREWHRARGAEQRLATAARVRALGAGLRARALPSADARGRPARGDLASTAFMQLGDRRSSRRGGAAGAEADHASSAHEEARHRRSLMDPAYISAFAALAGSAIGGPTSLAASWLNQHVQFRTQELTRAVTRREQLYKDFIEEASKWFADACAHERAELKNLVGLYALVSRMRILSSSTIVDSADQVVRVIIETYRAPNKTLSDVEKLLDGDAVNPLRDFSAACREEVFGR